MTQDKRATGNAAEYEACRYLQQQGLKLLERNFHCKGGELDLIMRDGHSIVFVEVRYRKNSHYGGALLSITRAKQRKLLHAANFYLQASKQHHLPCRFDVIAMQAARGGFAIEWLKNVIEE